MRSGLSFSKLWKCLIVLAVLLYLSVPSVWTSWSNAVLHASTVGRATLVHPSEALEQDKTDIPGTDLRFSETILQLQDQVWSQNPSESGSLFPVLQGQCSRTVFKPDVYLRCGTPVAGLMTIVSQLKTCVRIAIDTGSNLILPMIAQRDNVDLKDFNFLNSAEHKPLTDWFDEKTFVDRLNRACPAMKVVSLNDKKEPKLKKIRQEIGFDMASAPYYNGFGNWAWPGRDWATWWNAQMSKQIAMDAEARSVPADGAIIVHVPAPMSFFNLLNDISGRSLALWNELNYVFRFKPKPRMIINELLDSIKTNDTHQKSYLGVHFRTEKDSPDAWTSAEAQIERILTTAEQVASLLRYVPGASRTIYLACGDKDRIDQFKQAAGKAGWDVIDKYSMTANLDTDLHKELSSLPFDHQGMVDLAMLLRSEFFIGLTNSAFSFSIAHMRDPRGRFGGSTLENSFDESSMMARTHLFDDGEGAYQCCL